MDGTVTSWQQNELDTPAGHAIVGATVRRKDDDEPAKKKAKAPLSLSLSHPPVNSQAPYVLPRPVGIAAEMARSRVRQLRITIQVMDWWSRTVWSRRLNLFATVEV